MNFLDVKTHIKLKKDHKKHQNFNSRAQVCTVNNLIRSQMLVYVTMPTEKCLWKKITKLHFSLIKFLYLCNKLNCITWADC